MQKEIILTSPHCANVEELREVLDLILVETGRTHPSAVQLRCGGEHEVRVALEQETLTDGSTVFNLIIRGVRDDG